jgi:hypothetical protein
MIPFRKTLAAVLTASALAVPLAMATTPVAASPHKPVVAEKHFPSNPLHIKQASGNDFYVAATDISAGNPVTENFEGSARNMTWVPTGGDPYNGSPVGYLKFSNGNFMAAVSSGSNECILVTIKSSSTSNGTVWAWNTATGNLMINRFCGQILDPESALAGTNNIGDQWKIHGPAPGYYRNLVITHSS